MPLTLTFQEPDIFLVQASGSVSFTEAQDTQAQILADPRLADGSCMLVDCRELKAAPSAGELRQLAGNLVPMLDRGLGAIAIVTSSPMVYGVARMFATFAELVNAHVMPFKCMDEAKNWLKAA